jgi:hypothetical protein
MGLDISVVNQNEEELFSDRLGDVGFITRIRVEIAKYPSLFPLILNRVIYSNAHCGDELTLEQSFDVLYEAKTLKGYLFEDASERDKDSIKEFSETLIRACQCAIDNKANIVF